MNKELLYVFGEPGAGKSSLMAHLTRRCRAQDVDHPFAHRWYGEAGIYELGPRRKGGYPGTDGLSMSVQPRVVDWLDAVNPEKVIGEGDRLANGSFFEAARDMGYALRLVHLKGAAEARIQRQLRGSEQNEAWIDGRRAKCYNLAKEWWPLELPAGDPLQTLERLVAQQDWPIFESLQEARR